MHPIRCAILAAVLCTPAFAQERGAFIAFDGKDHAWCDVFEKMKKAGMNTAILQYTQTTSGYFYERETAEFIEAAEKARMNYYLGLRFHDKWDANATKISGYVEDSIRLMTKDLPALLPKPRPPHFKGWYMALEVGNDKKAVAHTFQLQRIATQNGDRIAMSVYFNPPAGCDEPKPPPGKKKLQPKEFAAQISTTINAYDVVILQDSVGKRGPAAVKCLTAYYKEIDTAYTGEPWIIVEAFRAKASAPKKEFKAQIEAALPLNKNIFAFEFLKNLYPKGSSPYAAWKERFGRPR